MMSNENYDFPGDIQLSDMQHGFSYIWSDTLTRDVSPNSVSNVLTNEADAINCHVPNVELQSQFGHAAGTSSGFPLAVTPELQFPEVTAGSSEVGPIASLPATNSWAGDCGFDVHFPRTEPPTGSTSWTYSHLKEKLYVRKDVPCPINFVTAGQVPHGSNIRAVVVFSDAQFASAVVKRCFNHSHNDISSGARLYGHIVRSESLQALYEVDPITEQHSVIVQYESPQNGATESTYIYTFACWGSCSGGINRRPIKIVFSLEHGGRVIGRKTVELRICACPTRDRVSDEKMFQAFDEKSEKTKKRKNSKKNEDSMSSALFKLLQGSPKKKARRSSPPPGPYNISIKEDYEMYRFLKRMKNFYLVYSAMNNLAPQIKQVLLQSNLKSETSSDEKKTSEESE